MKVYGDSKSGNCYKIKLLMSLLEIEHQWIDVDILAKETTTAEFLAMNPNGKIPLLALDDGRFIAESNAIINYLAAGTDLIGEDTFRYAKIQQWQFFEQYSHEPYIAVARFIAKYLGLPADRKAEYQAKQQGGHKALAVMEQQLRQSDYLVDDKLSTADIALYAYTHVAHEGGFDLKQYPAIQAWLSRIEQQPNYTAMG
ncbi:glutathione S-transferase family protein [Litorilituus sediminis]|uniref:Glutathione S-transferase family protein n=1 Tax=Litorilituus sediminis TaxID=718192 RepID=A0A4P6P168_9GAMM|nr:glutathione S-transferase family protein [Litorilituus sediminis]QBG34733.1 glutathione S-transferase family protein [Litorilituus sediminis]